MLGQYVKMVLGVIGSCCAYAGASPSYFLVAEPDFAAVHRDSFVLPLTDPADIDHARELITRGPDAGATIIFAEIAQGSGNAINRNLLNPGQPAWSWHISHFEGFADMGIELLDGWPTYVEQNRGTWFAQTGQQPGRGKIGFWSYTVVAELQGYPNTVPPIAVIPLPGGLAGGLATIGLLGAGWLASRKLRWR